MANQYGLFWNSVSSDRLYDADSFSEWLKKFFTTGVFNGDLQVLAASGMDVTVQTGYANIEGKVRFFDTATTFTLAPASGTYPRIDTIVVERNDTDREITVKYVQGTYSGSTPTPTAPVRAAGVYQIVLAQIYVAVGATEIAQGNITDTRANNNLCGWVVGTVDRVDVEQMTAQVQDEMETWFEGMKDQLSEDAAINLQNQINTINSEIAITEVPVTLLASGWDTDDDTYEITDAAIDPDKEIILTYDPAMLDDPYEALQDAGIRPYGAITSGAMTVKAVGGAPDVNLDIILLIRG